MLSASPYKDAKGNVIGVIGIGQDATELLADNSLLRNLLESANAPILVVDRDLTVTMWNQSIATGKTEK